MKAMRVHMQMLTHTHIRTHTHAPTLARRKYSKYFDDNFMLTHTVGGAATS